MQSKASAANARSLLGLNQRFIESATWLVRQDVGQKIDGGKLRITAGRNVIHGSNHLSICDAANHGCTIAVLRRLDGVSLVDRRFGLFQYTEVFLD